MLNLKSLAIFFCVIMFSSHAAFGRQEQPAKTKFTLKSAIIYAFNNNKDFLSKEKELAAAKANILGAKSAFLPNLSLNASYTHNDKIIQPQNIFTGYRNDNKAGLALAESLYNGGANTANFKQAQLGLDISQESLRAKKLDIEFEVKRLYYGLLLAYETERISKELLSQAKGHYADAQKKFDQATASKFDVLQSKVQVSKVLPGVIKAESSTRLIEAELKKILGLTINNPIELTGSLEYEPLEIKEEEFLKQAYLNKPEMVLESKGVDISKWAIETAKSENRPQVNALANYNYRTNNLNNMFNQEHNNWNAGFSITIPIFDGFLSKAKVDAAKTRYTQAVLNKENIGEQIAVDIRKGCLDLTQAQAIIEATKDNIEEAKETLRLAQVRYDNGEGTTLEIIDSQVSLSQIEQNYSSAVYDYLMAQAALDRIVGKEFLKEETNAKKN